MPRTPSAGGTKGMGLGRVNCRVLGGNMADIFADGEWFMLLFAVCSLALAGVIVLGLPTPRRSGLGRSIFDARPRTRDRRSLWSNTHTREPDRVGCGPRNADNPVED